MSLNIIARKDYEDLQKNILNKKKVGCLFFYTFEEQEDYIKKSVDLHSLVADKFDVEIDNKILESLLNRLREVY